ncbi:MAG: hypothetical protein HZA48_00310 [Planctomycetes bacterium]|nr:hypothetical protein [Planctomycetota bacterium]
MDFLFNLDIKTQLICLCALALCAMGIILYFVYVVSFYLCLDGINQLKETLRMRNEMKKEKHEALNSVSNAPGLQGRLNAASPADIAKTVTQTIKK